MLFVARKTDFMHNRLMYAVVFHPNVLLHQSEVDWILEQEMQQQHNNYSIDNTNNTKR